MASTLRLPGIQFDVVAPPADEALVRMDIAVFVGFTASGPLHQPVAVEDVPHFQDVFGSDLAIARDPASTQPVYAHLPSAVRAFFRNGGRRCWIVRVAGSGATSNVFPIPGLHTLAQGNLDQALARARSEGSWSDALVVGASLRSEGAAVSSFSVTSSVVTLLLNASGNFASGDLLRVSFSDSGDVLWVFVDSVKANSGGSPLGSAQPGQFVLVSGSTFYWQHTSPLSSPPSLGTSPIVDRLTMDLFVQNNSGQAWSLADLGFAPDHPRYWANLPDDATLYAMDNPSGLAAEAAHPRFPLAGPISPGYFLPLEVGPLPLSLIGPQQPASDLLKQDGLDQFSADLFLDQALRDTGSGDLLNEAFYIQFQSSAPRSLKGIHAALAVEEATIICAPDAVHRGWAPSHEDPLASPLASSPLQHPEWWHFLDCWKKQQIPAGTTPPPGQFQSCDFVPIAVPTLSLTPPVAGVYSLTWTPLANAVDYLEEAGDPGFASKNVIYQGSSGDVTVYGRPPGDYFYRLRRQIGNRSSDYSNGVAVRIEPASGWQVNPVSGYSDDTLLQVHQGLLRMCAARGDMLAVLSLPGHYRERESLDYAAKLPKSLGDGEVFARSFGALYHPWLTGREENDVTNLRTTPPDGAMAGIIAMRSSTRGPWIAPANEPLHGVVALDPAMARDSRQAFQDAAINLVRQEPEGFLCLCESTLSSDDDLVPVNVRRLLSFLRKTALKAGVDYVFDPNGDEFRRAVQRGFEKMLDGLFLRGAFKGNTSREAFQVVMDTTLNTPQAMDQGRFYVELRVAPSLPMRFLTVRLLQTADRTFVTEGK
jgi:hypothetical protein